MALPAVPTEAPQRAQPDCDLFDRHSNPTVLSNIERRETEIAHVLFKQTGWPNTRKILKWEVALPRFNPGARANSAELRFTLPYLLRDGLNTVMINERDIWVSVARSDVEDLACQSFFYYRRL